MCRSNVCCLVSLKHTTHRDAIPRNRTADENLTIGQRWFFKQYFGRKNYEGKRWVHSYIMTAISHALGTDHPDV